MDRLRHWLGLALWVLAACAPTATPPPDWTVVSIAASAAAEPWLAGFYACAAEMEGVALQRVAPGTAQIDLQIGEPASITGAAWQVGVQEVAIVVRADNPLDALNAAQIADLFQGRATDWAALGGEERLVQLWLYPPQSDLSLALRRRYLQGGVISPAARWQDDTQALAMRLETSPGALGVLPLEALSPDLRAAARWDEPVLALTTANPSASVQALIACVQAQSQKR